MRFSSKVLLHPLIGQTTADKLPAAFKLLNAMRILFVHDRFGTLAGAESNLFITASEFKERGHEVAILHGPSTGRGSAEWQKLFQNSYQIGKLQIGCTVQLALDSFLPDIVYVHKMPWLEVLETLVASGLPLVRMVHDHDIYCMRSYKYHPVSREICRRPAGLHCIFPCGAFVTRNRGGVHGNEVISW